jgi:hypothetical protein
VNAWILGKIALRLCENLKSLGVRADISKKPDPAADINHHIIYFDYDGRRTTTDTVMITHIDKEEKVRKVRGQLVNAEMGVCMSLDTVRQLAAAGLPRDRLCYINLAHDGVMKPRRLAIGITSKVQPDGCKREWMLTELAKSVSPADFEFFIMGSGWEAVVEQLEGTGFHVEYVNHFARERYIRVMPTLDYYLYMGQDDGSMGFIDALAAGIPTIVTPQGYHLDAPGGITYPFNEIGELAEIFRKIAEQRNARVRAVASWTWLEYARKHLVLWRCILARKSGRPVPEGMKDDLKSIGVDWSGASPAASVAP